MGFEEMSDQTLRGQLSMDTQVFADAERAWQALQADPRLATIKHYRDKYTAHSADPKAGRRLQYSEMFDFAKAVAAGMHDREVARCERLNFQVDFTFGRIAVGGTASRSR